MTSMRLHDCLENLNLYFHEVIANKLGRLLTLGKIFNMQTLKSSPTSCLYRINTSEVTNKLLLKISREWEKLILQKLFAITIMAVSNFCKMLHRRCLTGSWICLDFWFWIYQGSGYARVTQGSEYAWICLNNFRICLNMPIHVWMCLNLPEWLLLYFPIIIPCLLAHLG